MQTKLSIAIVTAGLLLGAVPPAVAGTVQQQKTAITIGVVHKSDGTWFTGKVVTPRAPDGEPGREVALFARGSVVGTGNVTGSTPGHSPGYWQVKTNEFPGISSTAFSALVFDRVYPHLVQPQIDELPQSSVSIRYSDGKVLSAPPPVAMTPTTLSILPVKDKPDGFWYTGAVTNRATGAGLRNHLVYLFTHGRIVGQDVSGSTGGHSDGYWQVKVAGFAGISQSYFDAYGFDRFYPGILADELPSQSPTIHF